MFFVIFPDILCASSFLGYAERGDISSGGPHSNPDPNPDPNPNPNPNPKLHQRSGITFVTDNLIGSMLEGVLSLCISFGIYIYMPLSFPTEKGQNKRQDKGTGNDKG